LVKINNVFKAKIQVNSKQTLYKYLQYEVSLFCHSTYLLFVKHYYTAVPYIFEVEYCLKFILL